MEWFGYVVRLGGEETIRKLMEGKPERMRTRGRPRLRWMDDVEQDLINMGVKRCRTNLLMEQNEYLS